MAESQHTRVGLSRDEPDRRPPDQVSATDEDHDNPGLEAALANPPHNPDPKASPQVWTPKGFKPFFPGEKAERPQSDETPQADNPFNPKGQPSAHYPQQATPLMTRPDGNAEPPTPEQNVYTPYPGFTDNVLNPRGTPDYLITGATPDYDERILPTPGPGQPNTSTEPPIGTPVFDNPKNPRGIPSNLCNGHADSQAFDSQKAQNPTPARSPQSATTYPDPSPNNSERVSAGQNRAPPQEVIP